MAVVSRTCEVGMVVLAALARVYQTVEFLLDRVEGTCIVVEVNNMAVIVDHTSLSRKYVQVVGSGKAAAPIAAAQLVSLCQ
jgi:uncharacterized protein YkvS